jgi:membrane protease YdiL (CAAX protease family)
LRRVSSADEVSILTKRYIAILMIYLLCFTAPRVPGFLWLAHLFPSEKLGYLILYSAAFLITLVIVLVLLAPERRAAVRTQRLAAGLSVLWAIGGVFALFFIQWAVALADFAIFGQLKPSGHTQAITDYIRTFPLFLVVAAIVGPILEEIVFRKIIYGALRRKIGVYLAAGVSSLIFALMHMDPRFLLNYFLIGCFLCFTYQMTRRIAVNMFMHASMNTIVMLLSLRFAASTAPALAFLF